MKNVQITVYTKQIISQKKIIKSLSTLIPCITPSSADSFFFCICKCKIYIASEKENKLNISMHMK